uniref:Nucleotide-diphospho-sugar transferase domain-containing protein n=1 Tax=Chrysotila carterae TaxID=13221 RepID=A0A6S9T7E1_CHRCT
MTFAELPFLVFLLCCTFASGQSTDDWRSVAAAQSFIHDRFDNNCIITVKASKNIHVYAPGQQLDTSDSAAIVQRLHNTTLLLCKYAAAGSTPVSTAGRYAVVTAGNTIDYLTRKDVILYSSLSKWEALRTKFEYGDKQQLPVFVSLGSLDTLQLKHKSPACPWGLKTKHNSLKVIGLLAVFTFNRDLAGLIYIDGDASILDYNVLPTDYTALSQASPDVIATSNWRTPVLANGGVLMFRNSPGSHRVLALWWAYRCLRHDQPGLWRALIEQMPGGKLPGTNHQDLWLPYHSQPVLHHFAHTHDLIRRESGFQTPWKCDGACGWVYRETGCLKEPLEIPGLLLLPPLPVDANGHRLAALQHYSGYLYRNESAQWICHTDNQGGKLCSPKTLNEERNRLQMLKSSFRLCDHCKIAANILRKYSCKKRGFNTTYLCNCEQVLLPEYEMHEAESKVIAWCRACPADEQKIIIRYNSTRRTGFKKIPTTGVKGKKQAVLFGSSQAGYGKRSGLKSGQKHH